VTIYDLDPEPYVVAALIAARDAHATAGGSPADAIRKIAETNCEARPTFRHERLLVRAIVSLTRKARRAAGEDTGPDYDWRLVWDLDRELVEMGLASVFDPDAARSFELPDSDPEVEAAQGRWREQPGHPTVCHGLGANCRDAERVLHRLWQRELVEGARLVSTAKPSERRLTQSELDAARDLVLGP